MKKVLKTVLLLGMFASMPAMNLAYGETITTKEGAPNYHYHQGKPWRT